MIRKRSDIFYTSKERYYSILILKFEFRDPHQLKYYILMTVTEIQQHDTFPFDII